MFRTGKYNREGRSREGAWIEIVGAHDPATLQYVAPVRERGLKLLRSVLTLSMIISRSREGAWIEIGEQAIQNIEIYVAPVRERGLKYTSYH